MSAAGLAFTLLTDDSDQIAATAPATSTSTSTSTITTTTAATTTSTTPPPAAAPPGAGSFADVYRQVNDGVVRIDAEQCGSSGVGTGFLIGRDMAVTAAHVVEGSTSLTVTTTGETSEGTVVGIDSDRDLALVQLDRSFRGHTFDFVTDRPDVGAPVALIGYPLGEPLSLATGAVSGLDRTVPTESGPLDGLIQTDVASNPGNSGGPLLNEEGDVIGVLIGGYVDAVGLAYAVSAEEARPSVSRWQRSPQPEPFEDCGDAGWPDSESVLADEEEATRVTSATSHPDVNGLASAFQTYMDGINEGDYESAYGVLAGDARTRTSYQEFGEQNSTSILVALKIRAVDDVGPAVDMVRLTFFSYQDPAYGPNGQDCSEWDLTYTMELGDGLWYINAASNNGSGPTQCIGD